MTILNETNPTEEQVREWGFDKDMYFIEQDEDVLLHNSKFVPVLLELAANNNCPKKKYCESILDNFSRLMLLNSQKEELLATGKAIEVSEHSSSNQWLRDWQKKFLYLLALVTTPAPLTTEECEKVARELNMGKYVGWEIALNQIFGNKVMEFRVYNGSYQHFFYINPASGSWKISKHIPLKEHDSTTFS